MIIELIGTLILTIATNDGLVVAADSRSMANGRACDSTMKIFVPSSPPRMIVAVSGNGKVVSSPGTSPDDICEQIDKPGILDIGATVVGHLEERGTQLPDLDIDELAAACLESVVRYSALRPRALSRYSGRDLFFVLLAGYTPSSKTAHIRGLRVGVSRFAEPYIVEKVVHDFSNDKWGFAAFGEAKFLADNVYQGVGKPFLSEETKRLRSNRPPAKSITPEQASAAAEDIIEAASKTTDLVPLEPGSGIGGPVSIVLIGADPRPKKLR